MPSEISVGARLANTTSRVASRYEGRSAGGPGCGRFSGATLADSRQQSSAKASVEVACFNNLAIGIIDPMTDLRKAASLLGRKSAEARAKKWGKKEFARKMQEWGKLGGRPKGSGKKGKKQ